MASPVGILLDDLPGITWPVARATYAIIHIATVYSYTLAAILGLAVATLGVAEQR